MATHMYRVTSCWYSFKVAHGGHVWFWFPAYLCPGHQRRAEDEEAAQFERSGWVDYSSFSSDESQRESDGRSS